MEAGGRGRDEGGRLGTRPSDADPGPHIRLAVALGDSERERAILPALAETGEFLIAERCLAADQLLACLGGGRVDVALVAIGLHRLTEGGLKDLARTRIPMVILTSAPGEDATSRYGCIGLPAETDPETVRQALLAAVRGEAPGPRIAIVESETPSQAVMPSPPRPGALSVIAVASGHGSPGRTTVALGLAAALGAVAPTVLIDADLSGPSLAACLDADPTRNLYMLAHSEPETPAEWARAFQQETQPLSPRSPHAALLCGLPKPEMRARISPRFLERLIAELRGRYRYVILDVGADLLGAEVSVHRTVLGMADQILLVTGGDLVSLWHTRTALGLLRTTLALAPDRVALVLNRYDRRHHHGRGEIEWALGLPAAAVISHDHGAAQRAIANQRPLVLEGGRAARALLDLAERLHGGRVLLPPEPIHEGGAGRRGWLTGTLPGWLGIVRRHDTGKQGAPHGEHPAPVR